MMYLFSLFFVFSGVTFAQEATPFDFLEASKSLMKTSAKLGGINGSYGGYREPDCAEKVTTTGETYMSCSVRETDFDNNLIIKADYTPATFPAQLKAKLPLDFAQKIETKNVSCLFTFSMSNDNQQMLGRRAEQHVKNSTYGDDFARTHGLGVGLSCLSEDGITSSYTYSTELYSNPDRTSAQREASGNVSMNQRFTSENIFALIQDNINQNQVSYWKQGVGFINLSEKKKWGALQSTGQQDWFHERINSIKQGSSYDYNYVEGTKDRWAPFVSLSLGLQMNKKFGDRCSLSASAEVGARVATEKQSTLTAAATAKLSYQVTDSGSIYLSAKDETTVRRAAAVRETTLAAGVETRAGSFAQISAARQSGNRKDVPDRPNIYTGKNDTLISIKLGYRFY